VVDAKTLALHIFAMESTNGRYSPAEAADHAGQGEHPHESAQLNIIMGQFAFQPGVRGHVVLPGRKFFSAALEKDPALMRWRVAQESLPPRRLR